jgi:hypothetical protein
VSDLARKSVEPTFAALLRCAGDDELGDVGPLGRTEAVDSGGEKVVFILASCAIGPTASVGRIMRSGGAVLCYVAKESSLICGVSEAGKRWSICHRHRPAFLFLRQNLLFFLTGRTESAHAQAGGGKRPEKKRHCFFRGLTF